MFCPYYLRIVKKTFLLLTETTGEILQMTSRSYLKCFTDKDVLLVLNEF